jgi:hypothetical protein
MDNWTGRKVECVRGRVDVKLEEGKIYVVAAKLDWCYIRGNELDRSDSSLSCEPFSNKDIEHFDSLSARFNKPKLLIVGFGGYFLDIDRFELIEEKQ